MNLTEIEEIFIVTDELMIRIRDGKKIVKHSRLEDKIQCFPYKMYVDIRLLLLKETHCRTNELSWLFASLAIRRNTATNPTLPAISGFN